MGFNDLLNIFANFNTPHPIGKYTEHEEFGFANTDKKHGYNIIDIVKTRFHLNGGKFVSYDGFDIKFIVKKGSESDSEQFLEKQKNILKGHGIRLFIKRTE